MTDQPAKAKTEAPTEGELKRAAYAAAERRLKEAHLDEFHGYVQEEADTRGVTYKRRLTEAEKAEQKLQELLAKHPELQQKFGQQQV